MSDDLDEALAKIPPLTDEELQHIEQVGDSLDEALSAIERRIVEDGIRFIQIEKMAGKPVGDIDRHLHLLLQGESPDEAMQRILHLYAAVPLEGYAE